MVGKKIEIFGLLDTNLTLISRQQRDQAAINFAQESTAITFRIFRRYPQRPLKREKLTLSASWKTIGRRLSRKR